ncbi:amino acid adenylation domain-containing protein [Streptomyces sp. TLI_235]|nr:non-ribosomal peptide synthetase [Streptomyces sp. TLI_235]PBC78942.1 amino acid adenylation domain-containing protein [Streptomyces sp. TLI_235]
MKFSLSVLFEEQVERAPDALAVSHPDTGRELSYRQLATLSERFARSLVEQGVTPGSFVAVCLPPGVDRIATFLAVLKTGAAYVPLDPAQPANRHRLVTEDSGARLTVTDRATADHFSGLPVLICEDAEPADSTTLPRLDDMSEEPAVVLYTSGTTGVPKGVVLPHRSIAHFVRSLREPGLGPQDRVAHVNSPAFDAITFDVWGALLTGAATVVLSRDLLTDAPLLGEAIRAHGVSAMLAPTSVFHEVALQDPRTFDPVRMLLVGGEAMDPRRARSVLATFTGHLMNVYGPTEATTFVTWHRVTEVPEGTSSVPIGRPLDGLRTVLLDEHRKPVADGEDGDLHLGGPSLALGYLGRPDLTGAAFVPDPAAPGELLYRTGDRARRTADGVLEYRGRIDRQVKIRGFRIELAEVEARLLERPDVANAFVIVRGEGADRSLAGFVVPADGADDPAELAARLAEHLALELPAWMVPRVTVLDRLPLTTSGKVDGAALARLVPERETAPGDGRLTPLETLLANIWTELTEVESLGPDDDFFAIGGHSILVGRLNAKIRSVLGVRPPLRAYYTGSTLSGQAAMLLAHEPEPGHVDARVSAFLEGRSA